MSKILKEISCVTGEYKNAQGETKKRYNRIGSIIETKNGPMLKIDSIPLKEGGWDGWAYINEPKKEEQQARPVRQTKPDFDDDVPF
jgi:hypothetical protein